MSLRVLGGGGGVTINYGSLSDANNNVVFADDAAVTTSPSLSGLGARAKLYVKDDGIVPLHVDTSSASVFVQWCTDNKTERFWIGYSSAGYAVASFASFPFLIATNTAYTKVPIKCMGNSSNLALCMTSATGESFGSAEGAIFIANATTAPTTDPTGGGILYVSAGALLYRGSSGTVTPIAPA